jgi:hypothetical protein
MDAHGPTNGIYKFVCSLLQIFFPISLNPNSAQEVILILEMQKPLTPPVSPCLQLLLNSTLQPPTLLPAFSP